MRIDIDYAIGIVYKWTRRRTNQRQLYLSQTK